MLESSILLICSWQQFFPCLAGVCLVPKICISSIFYIKALDVVDSFILCDSDRSLPNTLF